VLIHYFFYLWFIYPTAHVDQALRLSATLSLQLTVPELPKASLSGVFWVLIVIDGLIQVQEDLQWRVVNGSLDK